MLCHEMNDLFKQYKWDYYTDLCAVYIMKLSIVLLCVTSFSYSCYGAARKDQRQDELRRFPDDFIFGAATAAYQIEGAWDEDGRTPSIWDELTHFRPELIDDQSTGDVAADSYHNYKRDVEMMRELGLDTYRFSLSWSRILPSGFPNDINPLGVQYYNNLIDEMLKHNIKPFVTLYHWDLPQRLQELGGWTNPLIIDWFSDYARVVYEQFGDRVKDFITINEPREVCLQGYGIRTKAPALDFNGIAEYICAKNLLLAHAKAWHIYDEEFRPTQGGINGITLSMNWYLAESDSEGDIQAKEDLRHFEWEYVHVLYIGDWHQTLKDRIGARSDEQRFPRSRLPEFSPEEVAYIKGASDFLGINMYTTFIVYRNATVLERVPELSYSNDAYALTYQDQSWPVSASAWLKDTPFGLYQLLKQVKEEYNNPPVYITENGFSSYGGLVDEDRVSYYRGYLTAVLDALDDGCNVKGYMAWSLMDNFEWLRGYTERFGLYEVDYDSPEKTRTPRKSAFVYKEVLRSRVVDYSYQPDITTPITIDKGH